MKIFGIIAEYNPFHNGHKYHIDQIKKSDEDLLIGVLSSSLSSRGDLSIFDKFTKTKQALEAGIDLVIELPTVYAMQRADIFAYNTTSLLNLAKVNEIVIGSEENTTELYKELYTDYQMKSSNKDISMKEENKGLLSLKSNDTLGFFYYKAIMDNKYPMELSTIKRVSNDYHDSSLTGSISSATAIRSHLDRLEECTPEYVYKDQNNILDENQLFPYIKYTILSKTPQELSTVFFVDEGIEYKLKDIKGYTNLDSFITYLSGKKYTKARMKRMLMYILFNVKKDEMNHIQRLPIDTLRILGYSKKGKEYLGSIKKDISILTNIKEGLHPVWDIELRTSKILDSIYSTSLLTNEQKGPITI